MVTYASLRRSRLPILMAAITLMTVALVRLRLMEQVYRELLRDDPPRWTVTSTMFLVGGLVLATAVGEIIIWTLTS